MFIYTLYSEHLWKFDSECVALTLGAEKQKGTVFKYLSLTHKKIINLVMEKKAKSLGIHQQNAKKADGN